jgi:hypothetical protein
MAISDEAPTTINTDCYHCIISVIAQKMVQGGLADFQRLVGDLMQTAAEIIESQPPEQRAELKHHAHVHFRVCCADARETFDGKGGINQPAAGNA